ARCRQRSDFRVFHLDDHFPLPEMGVRHDVGDAVDGAAHNAGFVEDAVNVGCVMPGGPVADDAVQFVLVLTPAPVVHKAGIVGQFRLAHGLAQAAEQVVVVGGDDHPLPVPGLVDVGGGDAVQAGARGLADDAQL